MTTAPQPILSAALETLYRATIKLRNGALPESPVTKEMLLKLAEAIHDVPYTLSHWKGDEGLEDLRISFQSFTSDSWPDRTGLDLLDIFEENLKEEMKNHG